MMFELTDELRRSMVDHMVLEYPREACGLVISTVDGLKYIQADNSSPTPEDEFSISPEQFDEVEQIGDVVAIFHSHPDATSKASDADLNGVKASGLVWVIASYPKIRFSVYAPIEDGAPLYGRKFVHGSHDCFGFVRDWFAQHGVHYKDYDRAPEWWTKGEDLYMENFPKEGFVEAPNDGKYKVGDVLLMAVRSKVANHAAVYTGGTEIGHHLYGRLSEKTMLTEWWRRHVVKVIRHPDMPEVEDKQ